MNDIVFMPIVFMPIESDCKLTIKLYCNFIDKK